MKQERTFQGLRLEICAALTLISIGSIYAGTGLKQVVLTAQSSASLWIGLGMLFFAYMILVDFLEPKQALSLITRLSLFGVIIGVILIV